MPADYNPEVERFDRNDCGAAFLAAVQQLAKDTDRSVEEFDGRPLAEFAQLAADAYGESLPEFWQVWCSWHQPTPPQEMGDL